MVDQIQLTLEEKELELFVAEFSLEGVGEFHDRFRVSPGSFERAMESYEALVELQRQDPRLRIHATSCATDVNLDEIRRLTTYLFDRCPRMEHHNLVLIRGDRKNPALQGPAMDEYQRLYDYIRRLWKPREQGRYGSIVEPITQWGEGANGTRAAAGRVLSGRRLERRRLFERGRQRLREPSASGESASEAFLGDLEFNRGARTPTLDRAQGMLLHE